MRTGVQVSRTPEHSGRSTMSKHRESGDKESTEELLAKLTEQAGKLVFRERPAASMKQRTSKADTLSLYLPPKWPCMPLKLYACICAHAYKTHPRRHAKQVSNRRN